MKVLVSGACGFLGSHVCELFKSLGWEILAVDNLTNYEMSKSGYNKIDARQYNVKFLKSIGVNLLKMDVISKEYLKLEADYIVHTAAQPTMTLSITDPLYDLENNVKATVQSLELARKLDIPISICSSVHVFGNNINKGLVEKEDRFTNVPDAFNEDYPILNGFVSPLHASKASCEIYGRAYIDTYGLKVGIMRLSGMYGPRQFVGMHHGWVSNFIIRMIKDLPLYIYDTDKQVRDILYCSDAARLFLKFYSYQTPGLYVVGGGIENAVSLRDVISYISNLHDEHPNIIFKEKRNGDLYYFVSDNAKVYRSLRWKPLEHWTTGLEKTYYWILNNKNLFGDVQ